MSRTSQNSSHKAIENYVTGVEQQGGILTYLPTVLDNNVTVGTGNTLTLTGVAVVGLSSGVDSVIATNAHAFLVGQTSANPALNIDTSTASSVTGVNIKSAAAASGVAIQVISSGTNESLTVDAKGTGTVSINTLSTNGGVTVIGNTTTYPGISVNGAVINTTSSANALAVGRNGTTNPVLNVDTSTASAATGLNVKGAAAAAGLAVSVISSGTNENLTVDAKGSGTITVGGVSTGQVILGSTSNNVNFPQTEITSTNNVTATFLSNAVGGTGGPTTGAQHGWLVVYVAGAKRWVPVWL